jgi:hypothetical protein
VEYPITAGFLSKGIDDLGIRTLDLREVVFGDRRGNGRACDESSPTQSFRAACSAPFSERAIWHVRRRSASSCAATFD